MPEPSVHVIAEPVAIEETGLQMGFLADLTLKALYQTGRATAGHLGAMLALSQRRLSLFSSPKDAGQRPRAVRGSDWVGDGNCPRTD